MARSARRRGSGTWPSRPGRCAARAGGSVASRSVSQSTAARLPEGADQVLALGQVDAGLAADGRVDLAEQRGGHVHDGDAPVVDGGGEAGHVGDHAAADGHDRVGPGQAPLRPGPAAAPRWWPASWRPRRRRSRKVRCSTPGSTSTPMPGLGDDRDPRRHRAARAGQRLDRAGPDEHLVGPVAEIDGDGDHGCALMAGGGRAAGDRTIATTWSTSSEPAAARARRRRCRPPRR